MDDMVDARTRILMPEINPLVERIRKGEPAGDVIFEAITALKQEAAANGLTDEIVDEEISAWRAERGS